MTLGIYHYRHPIPSMTKPVSSKVSNVSTSEATPVPNSKSNFSYIQFNLREGKRKTPSPNPSCSQASSAICIASNSHPCAKNNLAVFVLLSFVIAYLFPRHQNTSAETSRRHLQHDNIDQSRQVQRRTNTTAMQLDQAGVPEPSDNSTVR